MYLPRDTENKVRTSQVKCWSLALGLKIYTLSNKTLISPFWASQVIIDIVLMAIYANIPESNYVNGCCYLR